MTSKSMQSAVEAVQKHDVSPRLKEKISRQYVDKEVKNRNDKRHFIDGLTTEAEEAADRQDMEMLYRITKRLNGD